MEAKKDTYTPVSVVMIVKNEAKIIRHCLGSASWADEIVVLDTGSEDNTVQICKDFGAKVFLQKTWEGFGKARQTAVKYATNDWIFSLDADEYASNELIDEISWARGSITADGKMKATSGCLTGADAPIAMRLCTNRLS